jgi:hypothetical protein
MKPGHCLLTTVALVSALGAALPSRAATDCLTLEINAPPTMCAGQTSSVSVTVTNSCSNRLSATARYSIDGQALPYAAGFQVGANSSRTRTIGIPVPASAAAASHTLTISLSDSGGGESSTTVDLTVSSCTAASGAKTGGRGLSAN